MTKHRRLRFVTAFVNAAAAILVVAGTATAQEAKQNAADAEWLVNVLEIRQGSVVGEIGAGDGALSFALARAAGPSGRVYSNELNKDRLEALRKEAEKQGITNVTTLEGREKETNFPEACCDAVFMRNVYHHFDDPPAMNASLLKSLKPGGRIAVIEFKPNTGKSGPPGQRAQGDAHGVMPETVIEELTAAGFVGVREVPWPSPPSLAVVGQKPARN